MVVTPKTVSIKSQSDICVNIHICQQNLSQSADTHSQVYLAQQQTDASSSKNAPDYTVPKQ